MTFEETGIRGVWTIRPERVEDERGFFARTWDHDEFAIRGIGSRLVQGSISFNRTRGTLRGLHYQAAPYEEGKLVRCTSGVVFDVALDGVGTAGVNDGDKRIVLSSSRRGLPGIQCCQVSPVCLSC